LVTGIVVDYNASPYRLQAGRGEPCVRPGSCSVPRIARGKFFAESDRLRLPLAVQVHYAVMDCVRVGRFHEQVHELLDHPDEWLGDP
jgi:hypothetical protein